MPPKRRASSALLALVVPPVLLAELASGCWVLWTAPEPRVALPVLLLPLSIATVVLLVASAPARRFERLLPPALDVPAPRRPLAGEGGRAEHGVRSGSAAVD